MDDSLALLDDQIAIHKRYSQHPYDLDADVADACVLTGDEQILDVGCGTENSCFSKLTGHSHPGVARTHSSSRLSYVRTRCDRLVRDTHGCRQPRVNSISLANASGG